MPKTRTTKTSPASTANIGFEEKLWQAADKLRSNMDAAEYKHVVLGLISLKYISDWFDVVRNKLLAQVAEGADPEDADYDREAGRRCHGGHRPAVVPRIILVALSAGLRKTDRLYGEGSLADQDTKAQDAWLT